MLNFSTQSFRILIALIAFVFLIILMLIKINQSLEDFKKVTGQVIESGITTISNSKGRTYNAFRIKLNTLDLNLGIKEYDGGLYEYFLANDPKGKEVTIYYDPEGKYAANNLTLHVGQIEIEEQILLKFEDTKTLYYFGAYLFTGLFMVSLPLYLWVLRVEKKNTNRHQ